MRQSLWSVVAACLAVSATLPATPAAAADDEVRATLHQLHDSGHWGELSFDSGGVRQVRVQALGTDSIEVRQLVGPLQERPAVYAYGEIVAARPLGLQRIPRRLAPYQPRRSTTSAVALEVLIPGAGYFYAGDTRQGWLVLGVSTLTAAVAVATGEDGVAGWAPFAVWTKIAAVAHLRDQVRAGNAAGDELDAGMSLRTDPVVPLASARLRF